MVRTKNTEKILNIPLSKTYRSSNFSSNSLYQGWLSPLFGFSDARDRVFLTSSHVSREWYERKIPKKNPIVSLNKP